MSKQLDKYKVKHDATCTGCDTISCEGCGVVGCIEVLDLSATSDYGYMLCEACFKQYKGSLKALREGGRD